MKTDKDLDLLKVPPHSMEAEQSVLGGLLLDNSAWKDVADALIENDFYTFSHRLIFRAISRLLSENQPADVITLSEFLSNHKKLEEAGGLPYLVSLARDTPSTANIKTYAAIVRDKALLREVIRSSGEVMNAAYFGEGKTADAVLSFAEEEIFKIASKRRKKTGFIPIKQAIVDVVNRIDTLYTTGASITGVSTGLHEIDSMTAGLQQSDLIIVAGRPSMGKTAFALGIASYVAREIGAVAVFSMEMSAEQITMRVLSLDSFVDMHKLRTGALEDGDWPQLTKSFGKIEKYPLFIDDTPSLSPLDVRTRARRLALEHGDLKLIIIDYMQLMSVPGGAENRNVELSKISQELKAMARELSVPVLALSQLNRNLEQRQDKRPVMSDLRDSGSLEQDADLIMLIYRDEVYNEDSADKGTAEIIIGKQRNGPTGTVRLAFLGACAKFENLARN